MKLSHLAGLCVLGTMLGAAAGSAKASGANAPDQTTSPDPKPPKAEIQKDKADLKTDVADRKADRAAINVDKQKLAADKAAGDKSAVKADRKTLNGDVQLTKVGSNASGPIQSVSIDLNLAAFGTSMIKGDFDYSVDFSNAMLGPSGVDQVELHASFADNSILFDVYDNSSGLNTHVWTGSLLGQMPTTATGGTFRISRVGTTLSGYFGSTLLYSTTSSSPLTDVTFILQLQPGSDDDISVIYDNFKFTAACGS